MAQFRIDEIVDRLSSGTPRLPEDAPRPAKPGGRIVSNVDREGYLSDVKRIIDYVIAGDVIQCVYSQRFSRETHVHPFNVYRTLRTVNPSPYTYYLEMGDHEIIGTSPELDGARRERRDRRPSHRRNATPRRNLARGPRDRSRPLLRRKGAG